MSIIKGKIAFINGTSSAGKSTIAEALISKERAPWIHLCLDFFFEMLPLKYQTADWPLYDHLCRGLHRSAVVWAETGLNVLVESVLERPDLVKDAATVLAPHGAYFIAITCSLEEARRREKQRGDRPEGLAKFQYDLVHSHGKYDLIIDSEKTDAERAARMITDLTSGSKPASAFIDLVK